MSLAGIIASSFLPAVLWLSYALYRQYLSVSDCFLSIVSGFCALASAVILALALGSLVPSWILYALVEEGMKLFFLYLLARRLLANRSFYSFAILAALVFSALETVRYGIYQPSVILLRTLTSLPLHASCSVIGSFALFRGTQTLQKRVLFFLVAVCIHGAYNVCMDTGGALVSAALAVLLLAFGIARYVWSRV